MFLVNILGVVALASAVIVLMIGAQQASQDRSLLLAEAAQAQAYARGGELSAITALRRDMVEAPEVDHLLEPWAAVAQEEVEIEGGLFTLQVADAQDRWNLNNFVTGGLAARATLDSVVEAVDLPPAIAERIAVRLIAGGPLRDLGQLSAVGLSPEEIAALSRLVVVLPPGTVLNVNTASAEALNTVLRSDIAGPLLVQRRRQRGYLTPADLEGVGVIVAGELGFTSDHYRVAAEVQVGDTRQRTESLLRRQRVGGVPEVVVVRRQRQPVVES